MTEIETEAGRATPNHHADHPGFSGPIAFLAGLTMLPFRGATARLVADVAGVGPGDHVVDVGCGPGGAAREAARRGARVTGVDPSAEMRALARLAGRRPGGTTASIDYVDGVAEDLPLADGAADVVWSIASVHHWPDLDAGLAEARRVLAAGGRLVLAERATTPGATGLASHGWFREQAEACAGACRAAGFDAVEVQERRAGRGTQLLVTGVRP